MADKKRTAKQVKAAFKAYRDRRNSQEKEAAGKYMSRGLTVAGGASVGLIKRGYDYFDEQKSPEERAKYAAKGDGKAMKLARRFGVSGGVTIISLAGGLLTGSDEAVDFAFGAATVGVERLASGREEFNPDLQRTIPLNKEELKARKAGKPLPEYTGPDAPRPGAIRPTASISDERELTQVVDAGSDDDISQEEVAAVLRNDPAYQEILKELQRQGI